MAKAESSVDWSLCMGFEYELRRGAIKYTREKGMSIQEALWAVYHNDHHRLENFSNFLRLSGSPQVADHDKSVQQLQKKVADLEQQIRSTSPRGREQLALPAPASSSSQLSPAARNPRNSKGKGKGKGKKEKKPCSDIPAPHGHEMPEGAKGTCFAFQAKKCTDSAYGPSPMFAWVASVPYDFCKCLRA